ncbi:MAG: hypothetical protein ABR592_02885 [Nitriliruptorales bacterium]
MDKSPAGYPKVLSPPTQKVAVGTVDRVSRKLDSWRKTVTDLAGARSEEFGAARRREAVTRERTWLQQTPEGPLEIVVMETDDPARTFQSIATSQEPFDDWFRQFVLELAGVDLSQPAPLVAARAGPGLVDRRVAPGGRCSQAQDARRP